MPICHLPNRDRRRNDVTTLKSACTHGPRFFYGDSASNKLTAATLPAADYNTRLFLPRAGAPRRWMVF